MEDQRLVGLITDGDVRRAFDSDRDYKTIDAAQMMTREPKTVRAGMRFVEAEAKMRDNKINAVVVKDEEASVAGVLQIYDFAEGEAELHSAS